MTASASPPAAGAPRVRPAARWVLPEPASASVVDALTAGVLLPEVVCRLLALRGYGSADAARGFLRPRIDQLHEPSLMRGLDDAVERLARAIRAGEIIFLHGDYDVDGICSTTLLTRVIRALGGTVVPFIPNRLTDGYDLGSAGVAAAIAAGARVVVTCDCGTSALGPIAQLCAVGIDVIVTDHHLPGGPLPQCLAVLNPKQPECGYPDDDLAAVGVAFKLAVALTREFGRGEGVAFGLLDLVALATVADLAPLRGENRIFVRHGLRLMAESRVVGMRALIRAAGLEGRPLNAGRIGFVLAPRLNAVGRLDRALRGVHLMLTEDEHEAFSIARDLEELNRRRQELDRATLAQARERLDEIDLDVTRGIVLAERGWHPGVIGIVASRVVEETCRPAMLIAIDGDLGKGSGRSAAGFDLHAGLSACADLLVRYGGHRAAAGITIEAARIPEFAERFNAVACERLSADDLVPTLRVDLELPIDDASTRLEELLRHFEPFGLGNPGPVLLARGVRLTGPPTRIGEDGIKCRFHTATGSLEAVGWGMAARIDEISPDRPLDVLFRLERDEYRGERRLQARLVDFRG